MFTTPSATTNAGPATADVRLRSSRKRKQVNYDCDDSDADNATCDDNSPFKKSKTLDDSTTLSDKPKKSPKKKSKGDGNDRHQGEEKRLRRFRLRAPQSYVEIKERALTQRLTILDRERSGTDQVPEEKVVMAGSTGNVYTQHIRHIPSCDCPHAKKGNQCKHIIYVMLRVLKAPEHVGYQLALTSGELRDLFKNAAPIPRADATDTSTTDDEDGNRKPIEGECPICYTDFEPEKEAIVYCKAACGNNIHKDCMQSWMAAKAGKATCPCCRAQWADEDIGSLRGRVNLEGATKSEEGYVNVAGQLGLSGERDYSSYHQFSVRRQFGYGR
ncbi:hypothetical protein K458DRAFT_378710 [Lentithecium fluviatile CBS 122367]|uniref:Uncharacterized protein n=1 Tax=Lentithecium fluviatile CBS 122367 TaxID=1168545 RepID=A0A6G1IG93_9PLEO|nr:hypothetical protein K458DRAFT_378710 [Lentithecium fluviatile CBS 122367]